MAWLGDWAKRIKLTISGSCIEGDLIDFPIMVHLDSTCSGVFNEIGANSKKIAVTALDCTQCYVETERQCYVEIENWDNGNSKAWLWTKVPALPSGADTDIYLYYDNTKGDNTDYVGDVGSTPAQNVWDSNFVGVWHLSQDPTGGAGCIKDSTNTNHGTPVGSMTSSDLVDGKVGKALDFDGGDDYINLDAILMASWTTMSAWIKVDTAAQATAIAGHLGDARWDSYGRGLQYGNGKVYAMGESANDRVKLEATVNDTAWHYITGVFTSTGKLYVDGVQQDSGDISSGCAYLFAIAASRRSGENARNFDGLLDEVRLSNTTRSVSWVKATYHSKCNTLLAYGGAEDLPYRCFSGVVKVEGALSARKVNLYNQDTGELIKYTTSNSGTGAWSIDVYDYISDRCFAVCIPESESRNAEVFAHLTGV